MPIKRILLGGISRTPSDRMSASGAVAESVNVCINTTEVAPVVPPVDLAQELGLPTIEHSMASSTEAVTDTWRAVYIHKVNGESHYIYVCTDKTTKCETLYAFTPTKIKIGETLADGETFVDDTIIGIGNMLVYSTTAQNGYALWRDGSYTYLGDDIPQLKLNVRPELYSGDAVCEVAKKLFLGSTKYSASWLNAQIKLDEDEREEAFSWFTNPEKLWDVQGDFLNSQYFRYPVFVRFALKLYDNTYIHHTVPIYMSGGDLRYEVQYKYTSGTSSSYICWAYFKQTSLAYKIKATIDSAVSSALSDWKDVVQSIDMFISAPIIYPYFNSELKYCVQGTKTDSSGALVTDDTWMKAYFDTAAGTKDETAAIKNLLLDRSRLFYKVRSFKVEELSELESGIEISNSAELSYTENLYTRESLTDDFRTNHSYISSRNYNINRRLLSIGMSEVFTKGMSYLYGVIPTTSAPTLSDIVTYQMCYEITDNDGTKKYVYSDSLFNQILQSHTVEKGSTSTFIGATRLGEAAQLLFYPDSRCTAVYIVKPVAATAVKLTMTGHPYLNCAYYLNNINKTIADFSYTSARYKELPMEARLGSAYKSNYVFQSAVENPFAYPAVGRVKLNSGVIAVASISTALSQGQYGQYDLYAFTEEGIFSLKGNDEGDFSSITPLSRDVCLSASAVVGVDQGVVFVTAKGVMLLTGSQITNLSAVMTGKPYIMEDKVAESVNSVLNVGFKAILQSNKTLIDFMKTDGTQVGYDYTGARLLFINKSFRYFYTYMFGTQSWHKYVLPTLQASAASVFVNGLSKAKVLNGYPECLLFAGIGNAISRSLYLYDMSTRLDELDETTEIKGVVATRAFNLEAPDIHKTINHIKIRGQYAEKDSDGKARVSYILMGSQDGLNFTRLTSLRGKSWKYYRIILMLKLKSTERISWIDIDYESRFNNKLR